MEKFKYSSWEGLVALAVFSIIWLIFSSTRSLSLAIALSLLFLAVSATEAYDLYRYINYYNNNVYQFKNKTDRFYYNRPEIIKKIRTYFDDVAYKFVIPFTIGCFIVIGFLWFVFLTFVKVLVQKGTIELSVLNFLEEYGWVPVCWFSMSLLEIAKKFFKKRNDYIQHALEYSKYAPNNEN